MVGVLLSQNYALCSVRNSYFSICAATAVQVLSLPSRADEGSQSQDSGGQPPIVEKRHLPNSHAGTRNIDGMTVRTNPDGTVEVVEPAFNETSVTPTPRPAPVHKAPPAKHTPPKTQPANTAAKPNEAIDSYIKKYKPYVQSMQKSSGKAKSHPGHGQLLPPKSQ